ncbi:MAG TPA: peptidase M28, partial [Symbiobacteriaceae bacterium]|nr:peptidase M28 [Symbiobacteriaceae bacterium]
MSKAYEYLRRLSRYPHRGTATPLEAAAAKEMAGWLREMGYSVSLQPFRAPRDTLYLGPSVVMLGFILGAALGRGVPWAGIGVSLLFLAPMVGELLGSSWLDFDWLLPTYPSQNVVARKAPAGSPGRTLVITAHYDTQRASLLFHPRMAPHLQGYFTCVYALLAAVPVLLLLRWIGATWTAQALTVAGGLLAVNVLFLAVCWRTGRYINGANDNGSGVAMALALAERFATIAL